MSPVSVIMCCGALVISRSVGRIARTTWTPELDRSPSAMAMVPKSVSLHRARINIWTLVLISIASPIAFRAKYAGKLSIGMINVQGHQETYSAEKSSSTYVGMRAREPMPEPCYLSVQNL